MAEHPDLCLLGHRGSGWIMVRVHIPTYLRARFGGTVEVLVDGRNLRQVLEAVDGLLPGFLAEVLSEGEIRSELAVAVDGEIATRGLVQPVGDGAEVHLVPALSGGR